MKTLGVITARGGSKGIPNKNLVQLCGRPLLWYTTSVALRSSLTQVILSTDSEEIASAGRDLGIQVPFLRPPELAADNTPTIPVVQDAVRRMESTGLEFEAIFTLQPTNPFRTVEDINGSIDMLTTTGADSVISFVEVGEKHPARMKRIDAESRVIDPPFKETLEGQRRQDLEKMYLREGSVYLTRRKALMEDSSLQGTDCRAWIIPRKRAVNIDEPFDLQLAEFLMQKAPD